MLCAGTTLSSGVTQFTASRKLFPKPEGALGSPEKLPKTQIARPHHRASDSNSGLVLILGWVGLGIYISTELLGGAVFAGPGTTIWGALLTNTLIYQRHQKELLLGEGCDICHKGGTKMLQRGPDKRVRTWPFKTSQCSESHVHWLRDSHTLDSCSLLRWKLQNTG